VLAEFKMHMLTLDYGYTVMIRSDDLCYSIIKQPSL